MQKTSKPEDNQPVSPYRGTQNKAPLIKALIEFQKTCPSIAKDTEGYGYKYTPLEKFLSVVNPALNRVGLAQSQSYDLAPCYEGDTSKTLIITTLYHESGASITSRLPVREPLGKNPKKDIMHEWGGITTYSRRYALKMILGLEPDMDMNLEDIIIREEKQNKSPQSSKIVRTPQRGANAKKVADEMIIGTPLDQLFLDLQKLNLKTRSEVLVQFKALNFPQSTVKDTDNKGMFALVKTDNHIKDVRDIMNALENPSL